MNTEFEITRVIELETVPHKDGNGMVYVKWQDEDEHGAFIGDMGAVDKLNYATHMLGIQDSTQVKCEGHADYIPLYVTPDFIDMLMETGEYDGETMEDEVCMMKEWGQQPPANALLIFVSSDGKIFRWMDGTFITTRIKSIISSEVHYYEDIRNGKYTTEAPIIIDWEGGEYALYGLGKVWDFTCDLSPEDFIIWHEGNAMVLWNKLGGVKPLADDVLTEEEVDV